jgi:hypothetical protein
MKRALLVIALAATVILTLLFLLDERNRLAIALPEGVLHHGSRLGVYVGQEREAAGDYLASQGLVLESSQEGGSCVRHSYPSGQQIDVYSDQSWRNGTVCLISQDARIFAVEWFFAPLKPEL